MGLKQLTSTGVPLPIEHVDTDQIIPARFLKAIDKEGFGANLFRDWRYDKQNNPIEGFVLNDSTFSGEILVAGKNFGCGSSREHAAWAIGDFGFRVVISSFFADIFKGNALNNNILPITVSQPVLDKILEGIFSNPKLQMSVDLEAQKLTIPDLGIEEDFEISEYKKMCLINGYDDIDYIRSLSDKINEYEQDKAYNF